MDYTALENLDHLATVLINVVRMNKVWNPDDLKHLANYVKKSNIDKTLQKVILTAIVDKVDLNLNK